MSWMDSWSRPGKHSATPPPLYVTHGTSIKYCQTCGRLISPRKSHGPETTQQKYCSSRCRSDKPGHQDRRIEDAFETLLNGHGQFEDECIPETVLNMVSRSKVKGERRVVVPCSAVETLIFGSRQDPTKNFGRKKNRASRAIGNQDGAEETYHNGPHIDDLVEDFSTTGFAGKTRPPQNKTVINGSVGGEKGWAEQKPETEEAEARRKEGLRAAAEKEMVKRAARRGCVLGLCVNRKEGAVKALDKPDPGTGLRYCEAIMNGHVVEPSYAKGDWGIRWRD